MILGREIKKITDELEVLEVVTRAFSEIASTHMKQTRGDVVYNRDFVADLSNIFEDVRLSFTKEYKKRGGSKSGKITFLSHNGKTVSVLLSAQSGLFGKIISETFTLFKTEAEKNTTEVTVVGRQGLALFTTTFPGRAYTYFDIEDNKLNQSNFSAFARHVVQYDEIHLYFGKFKNVVIQEPEMLSISSLIDVTGNDSKVTKYLFEPDLISIIQFFERELFASLLSQTFQESALAKYASRVLAMDQANERITHERKKLSAQQLTLKHNVENKKQLNSLYTITLPT